MNLHRRTVLGAGFGSCAATTTGCGQEDAMYGLIGKMIVKPGQRDALVSILLEGTGGMPGCRIYLIATDPGDANAVWISEAWDSEADHRASLQLPQVQAAIARARPLIESFGERFITNPVGGVGLDR
jgi:quinol monooxygenase YgiN